MCTPVFISFRRTNAVKNLELPEYQTLQWNDGLDAFRDAQLMKSNVKGLENWQFLSESLVNAKLFHFMQHTMKFTNSHHIKTYTRLIQNFLMIYDTDCQGSSYIWCVGLSIRIRLKLNSTLEIIPFLAKQHFWELLNYCFALRRPLDVNT